LFTLIYLCGNGKTSSTLTFSERLVNKPRTSTPDPRPAVMLDTAKTMLSESEHRGFRLEKLSGSKC